MVNIGERSGSQKHRVCKKIRYYKSEARIKMYGSDGIFSTAVNIATALILCLGLFYISDLISGVGWDRITNISDTAANLLTNLLSFTIANSASFVINISLVGAYRSVYNTADRDRKSENVYALSDLMTPGGFRYSIKLYLILTFLKSPIFALLLTLYHFKDQIRSMSYFALPSVILAVALLCFIYLSYFIASVSLLPYAEGKYGRKSLKITLFMLKNARRGFLSGLILLLSFTPQLLISAMTFFISFIAYTGPYLMFSVSELGRHIYLENNLRKDNKINE